MSQEVDIDRRREVEDEIDQQYESTVNVNRQNRRNVPAQKLLEQSQSKNSKNFIMSSNPSSAKDYRVPHYNNDEIIQQQEETMFDINELHQYQIV